jgi:hypothetical protein
MPATNDMELEVIEVSDAPPAFDKQEWIGKGRKYPTNAPLGLVYYCDRVLSGSYYTVDYLVVIFNVHCIQVRSYK